MRAIAGKNLGAGAGFCEIENIYPAGAGVCQGAREGGVEVFLSNRVGDSAPVGGSGNETEGRT